MADFNTIAGIIARILLYGGLILLIAGTVYAHTRKTAPSDAVWKRWRLAGNIGGWMAVISVFIMIISGIRFTN